MRILFCCQFYSPSVGGVQEVIRQLAEQLVARGHKVTVATTAQLNRNFTVLNGVDVKGFNVAGNIANGMTGEIREFHEYILKGEFDVMLVYAAQQWTFDALWEILDKITFPKVFVPCGFSGLYESGYVTYFQRMPDVLRKFDHLIFNASKYRDIDFAKKHGIDKFSIIANGASEVIFNVARDSSFRSRYNIQAESFMFLTVGSFTGLKGHLELVKAFSRLQLIQDQHATLMLNGNEVQPLSTDAASLFRKFFGLIKVHGLVYSIGQVIKKWRGVSNLVGEISDEINDTQPNKTVLITDLSREELTQAFMAADLFVFASNIEYSPLVLFETAAAGTPFLSVKAGNAEEIAEWTGAGVICPSVIDSKGYTRVDEVTLSKVMLELMQKPDKLKEQGETGKRNWLERLTWSRLTVQYEQIFNQLVDNKCKY
jgi:glycosyltransferase involved in cell wall biosynthesis